MHINGMLRKLKVFLSLPSTLNYSCFLIKLVVLVFKMLVERPSVGRRPDGQAPSKLSCHLLLAFHLWLF